VAIADSQVEARRVSAIRASLFLLLVTFLIACGARPRFAAYDVTNHDDPSLQFHFSAGDASPSSPIVISAPGRTLTSSDDRHRLDLEKAWLSAHLPESLGFVSIGSAICDFKLGDAPPFCEVYDFEDSKKHERVSYYFYVGNWPVAGK
jgi:hypothetical protein